MRTIYILWLRQIKRSLRSRARLIGSLGQPLLFLVGLSLGFGPIFERAGGGDYLQFLAPGVIAMGILFTGMFSGMEVIWDRQFGFLKETLVAPVPRLHIMLGRTLGGATIATVQGIIVLCFAMVAGFRPENAALLPAALLFMFCIGLFSTAVGSAIASVLEDFQGFQLIMNFLVMPMFFLSGALFPIAELPPGVARIALLDPISYGVDGLRGTLIGMTHFGLGTDLAVLAILIAAALGIGSWLFSRVQV